jgi:hypothetical protein
MLVAEKLAKVDRHMIRGLYITTAEESWLVKQYAVSSASQIIMICKDAVPAIAGELD